MKLPVIKSIVEFIDNNDEDFVIEATEVLEHLSMAKGLKEDELLVIGELLSNMFGALEVKKMISNGETQNEALNKFMKRVMGAVGK